MLTAAQRAQLATDGFVVLPGFVDEAACGQLRARALELVAGFDAEAHRVVFDTTDQAHSRDRYFLDSAANISFFFETEAFDDLGNLRQAKELSLNKLGHAMHDLDPVFEAFSHTDTLAELGDELGLADPRVLQSMYIFKQPHIGGEVNCHTDHTFLWTEPQSVVGFWFAIDRATVDNGCMFMLPGGHRLPVKSRFRRDRDGGTVMEVIDATPYPNEGLVPIEADVGTLVVFNGATPHLSAANRSAQPRHAYTLHVIDGACDYPADNWLQRPPTLPLRGFR